MCNDEAYEHARRGEKMAYRMKRKKRFGTKRIQGKKEIRRRMRRTMRRGNRTRKRY